MAKRRNTIAKPERGLGQAVNSMRSSARRAVVKEQKERRKRILDDMRGEAERHVDTHSLQWRRSSNNNLKPLLSILSVVRSQQQAVADSYGIHVPISLNAGFSFRASTDYKTIDINWSQREIPDLDDSRAVAEAIIALRGVCQHELGHNLHSIRPRVLWEHPSTQAVVTQRNCITQMSFLHVANILEDQRMECRMVRDVPRLAAYFTVMAERWLQGDNKWVLVAGRSFLPEEVRALALAAFNDDVKAQQWLQVVNRYKTARSVKTMAEAIVDGWDIIQGMPVPEGTEHERPYWQRPSTPEDHADADERAENGATEPVVMPKPQGDQGASGASESDEDGSDGDQEQGQGQSGSEDDQDGSESNGGADGETDSSTDADSGNGAATGKTDLDEQVERQTDANKAVEEAVKKAAQEALEEIRNSESDDIEETVSEVRKQAEDFRLSRLPDNRFQDMHPITLDLAMKIAERMRLSLQQWVTAAAPVWQSHQEQGVIDALAWRTHRVGERDYHRSMTGTGSEGLDLHLTLMADASGSMSDHMGPLSAVMYGTAAACDELGIDRTMVLWSDNTSTHRVWDKEAATPIHMESDGGTDPIMALDDMTTHNENGRGHHIVVVFTDGQWGGFGSLQEWADDNRKFILVKFGPDAGNYTYGADHSIYIPTIEDMQYHIAAALDDTLASIY
jgi:hypothetical protein